MKRITLSAVCLSMLSSLGVSADEAPRCCFSMAAYVNDTTREMPCNDPFGHVWFCPRARAHMPVQNFCDPAAQYANTSKKCLVRRPNAKIPMLWVMCGPSVGQCLDGPPSGATVDAFNDVCGGACSDRNAGGACSNEGANAEAGTLAVARIAKRQNEELEEALLANAQEREDDEALQKAAEAPPQQK